MHQCTITGYARIYKVTKDNLWTRHLITFDIYVPNETQQRKHVFLFKDIVIVVYT